jgi:hypothetical protein
MFQLVEGAADLFDAHLYGAFKRVSVRPDGDRFPLRQSSFDETPFVVRLLILIDDQDVDVPNPVAEPREISFHSSLDVFDKPLVTTSTVVRLNLDAHVGTSALIAHYQRRTSRANRKRP